VAFSWSFFSKYCLIPFWFLLRNISHLSVCFWLLK
jgi:hypothetical protein